MQLAQREAEELGDDIVSTLIDSEADGQLTEEEYGMFVVTLTVAATRRPAPRSPRP
jgi:cholest-4-en-3-one 26-monooxygenase